MSKKNKNSNNNFNFSSKNKAAHPNIKNLSRNPEELKQQLMPLYMRSSSYGKTAMVQGDTIEAERHFQQAEHYMRMINNAEGANAAQANAQRHDGPEPAKKQAAPSAPTQAAEDIPLEGFPEAAVDLATTSKPEPKTKVSIHVSVDQSGSPETEPQKPTLGTTPAISAEAPKKRRGRPPKDRTPKQEAPASTKA